VTDRGHSSTSELEAYVALSLLRAGSDTKAARLLLDLVREGPLPSGLMTQLADALEIPPLLRRRRIDDAWSRAAGALDNARREGLSVIPLGSDEYPVRLRWLPDPPTVLWVKGDPAALGRPAMAVVGSRAATPAGLLLAKRLSRELTEAGLLVVSGLARGIDGAAHEGALEAGGTVAVLGCGADRVYPAEHRTLAARIVARGAIVSELAPGTPPLPRHFPLRNRIISGLSLGVLIVEASFNSGSLITARAALEQGRSVLAVPGGVASGRHRGCHALIKDGARLVESVEDVLDELSWPGRPAPPKASTKSLQVSQLQGTMTVGEPYSVEDLAARTGRATPELLAELGGLELAGRVARNAGGSYIRLD
jgi:DNA processing protein